MENFAMGIQIHLAANENHLVFAHAVAEAGLKRPIPVTVWKRKLAGSRHSFLPCALAVVFLEESE
jgi:hypothetical protein